MVKKNSNFGSTISTWLNFFEIGNHGNFYCSQVQSSQKISILAKTLNMAKIVTFTYLHDSQISNGQTFEFWAHNFNSSQNSETSTFIVSKYRAVKNLNFGQKFKHGK